MRASPLPLLLVLLDFDITFDCMRSVCEGVVAAGREAVILLILACFTLPQGMFLN